MTPLNIWLFPLINLSSKLKVILPSWVKITTGHLLLFVQQTKKNKFLFNNISLINIYSFSFSFHFIICSSNRLTNLTQIPVFCNDSRYYWIRGLLRKTQGPVISISVLPAEYNVHYVWQINFFSQKNLSPLLTFIFLTSVKKNKKATKKIIAYKKHY